ncbi:MAG: hypothetical protein KAT16_00815, partial [Candidatus Heimdallarchaeota archaeon]|nr:hypothetical protein [Candidatus Heimdallarchaeota archaeon]
MSKLTKIKYSLIVVVLITLMSFSSVAIMADTAPIVPIGNLEDKYSPSTYNDADYYVLPPGTTFSDVIYGGGSGTTTDTRYTRIHGDDYFFDSGYELEWLKKPTNNILTSDIRYSAHRFFDDVLYPRVVRIDSSLKPEFVQTQRTMLSLHNDYSTTFFAEGKVNYEGYFNTTGPFFIDIEVSSSKVWGDISFDSVFPEVEHIFGDPETKMTFPVIPETPGLQKFEVET